MEGRGGSAARVGFARGACRRPGTRPPRDHARSARTAARSTRASSRSRRRPIATLIEHYLRTSEQIDSRMAIAAVGPRARGLLLQRLPGAAAADDATWTRAAAHVEALLARSALRAGQRRGVAAGALSGRRRSPVQGAARALPVQLLGGTRRERAADDRPGRSREHPRRAGTGRRHLRVLQPAATRSSPRTRVRCSRERASRAPGAAGPRTDRGARR